MPWQASKPGAVMPPMRRLLCVVFGLAGLSGLACAATQAPPPEAAAYQDKAIALSEAEAARLEERLKAAPDDESIRERLLFHYLLARDSEALRRHACFLVRKRPGAGLARLASMHYIMAAADADRESVHRETAEWWIDAGTRQPGDSEVAKNASQVLRNCRRHFEADEILRRARQADPGDVGLMLELASLYASALANREPFVPAAFTAHVRAELASATDTVLVAATAHVLLGSLERRATLHQGGTQEAGELQQRQIAAAELCLQRLQAIAPGDERTERIAKLLAFWRRHVR